MKTEKGETKLGSADEFDDDNKDNESDGTLE